MVSDCRTRRYHPAVLVGGARMCACCIVRVASPPFPCIPLKPHGTQWVLRH
ncbi:unnamed protein product [Acanthoscelides obtectus]|uniref:Uncharacterized protein n=1 Tax=Acanthoscelides obtectus TaxID=200917 RepID=A0A9P0KZ18_ACAOB|nr:unnamed protein product [Acanthoscelides obtectus]CAK1663136.1 hypothetical protein AOBTE_LOCUS23497 [Acanthoscelides obtectus]